MKIFYKPTEELLSLDILKPENSRNTLHAYQMVKRCNEKRPSVLVISISMPRIIIVVIYQCRLIVIYAPFCALIIF